MTPDKKLHRTSIQYVAMAALSVTAVAVSSLNHPCNAQTLTSVLSSVYAYNPTLQAERAQLRSVDEDVPSALAGWRPTVSLSASAGYAQGNLDDAGVKSSENRDLANLQAEASETLYDGGKTRAKTTQAKNKVRAERANLINVEQQVFASAISAYVTVIEDEQLLALGINNAEVLKEQLRATQDRFRVGEITRTDVAQSESSLAAAEATVATDRGNLQSARATFKSVIGFSPGTLTPPEPLALPIDSSKAAAAAAKANNPAVVQAMFTQSAAADAVDVAWSALMPTIQLQVLDYRQINQSESNYTENGAELLASLSIPLYQGGSEYAAIRQAVQQRENARQEVDVQRRTAVETATQNWESLITARATIESTRAEIAANEIALDGTEREAIVGSRTTLDVLNAQQLLLESQVTLVQNLATLVIASYNVAEAIGRLTARDLALHVPLYDDNAYYDAVKNAWFGTGDPTANTMGDAVGSP